MQRTTAVGRRRPEPPATVAGAAGGGRLTLALGLAMLCATTGLIAMLLGATVRGLLWGTLLVPEPAPAPGTS